MEKLFAAKPFLAKKLSMTSLRRRMIEDMQVRNLSSQTQATYVQQVSLFARHFNKSPEVLGPEEIRSYQVYLTNEKKLAPSSIITAVAALRFLYKVTLPKDWSLEEIIPAPSQCRLVSGSHFAGTKSQTRQQKQNGVVALANRGVPIAAVQDTLDLLRKELRHAR